MANMRWEKQSTCAESTIGIFLPRMRPATRVRNAFRVGTSSASATRRGLAVPLSEESLHWRLRLTCRISSDRSITGEWRPSGRFRSLFFVVSASRHRRRAPPVNVGPMFRLEGHRRQVPETRMRPYFVVMAPPLLDAHLRVCAVPEPLQREMLVAELPVERFVGAVLPRLPRIDESGFDLVWSQRRIAVATNSGPLSERR